MNTDLELEKILYTAMVNWQTSPDEIFDKGVTAYAKQALLALHTKAVVAAQQEGHWYTKSKQLDAYHNMAHYCRCGYRASQRGAIDGHVEWQLKALQATAARKETV